MNKKKKTNTRFLLLFNLVLCLFIFSPDFLVADEVDNLFEQANTFLQQGQYQDAIKVYHELERQSNDTNLYYNLGNCYYQTKQIGFAVLYYKRALLIDSSNSLARKALSSVESSIISTNRAETTFFNRLLKNSYNWMSINKLAIIVSLLLLVLFLMIYLFLSHSLNISIFAKRFYITLNIFLIVFFVSISISKWISYINNQEIVLITSNTIVHKEESNRIYSTNSSLKEGLTLKFISSLEDKKTGYSLVSLPNGEKIVINNDNYAKVRPQKR